VNDELEGCGGKRSWPNFKVLTNCVAQEPEGSSPHSQQPATGPCPEPVESNPHPQANLPKIYSDSIFPPTPWSPKWRTIRFHGLRKTTKNLSQDSRSPGRDLDPVSPEYGAEC
jgi:hypothetical protein